MAANVGEPASTSAGRRSGMCAGIMRQSAHQALQRASRSRWRRNVIIMLARNGYQTREKRACRLLPGISNLSIAFALSHRAKAA